MDPRTMTDAQLAAAATPPGHLVGRPLDLVDHPSLWFGSGGPAPEEIVDAAIDAAFPVPGIFVDPGAAVVESAGSVAGSWVANLGAAVLGPVSELVVGMAFTLIGGALIVWGVIALARNSKPNQDATAKVLQVAGAVAKKGA